jgi:hypothetical protein
MTQEERRKCPAHHVVHDFANLVSSGRIRLKGEHMGVDLLSIAPVNSHNWHAFYMNCRKMYEFFCYPEKNDYLRARHFLERDVNFKLQFNHWTTAVQKHMEIHIMHVGGSRTTREVVWTGSDDPLYLADFEAAWKKFLSNLTPYYGGRFKNEIDYRLNSEFRHCGDLGRPFIP